MKWILLTLDDGRRALVNPAAIASVEPRREDDPPLAYPDDIFSDDFIILDDKVPA